LCKSLNRFYSGDLNPRWLALRLLDGDPQLRSELEETLRKNGKTGMDGGEENQRLIGAFLQEAESYRRKLGPDLRDRVVRSLYQTAEDVVNKVVHKPAIKATDWNSRIDNIVTSRLYGYPIMLLLLGL